MSRTKIVSSLIGILGILGVGFTIWDKANDGFYLHRIFSEKQIHFETLGDLKDPSTQDALAQEYEYLDQGHQIFAFISKDGKYILKFMKNNKFPFVKNAFYQLPPFRSAGLKVKAKRDISTKRHYHSCEIAFEEYLEQTALLYIHFNTESSDLPSLKIKDKIGLSYQVDLNKVEFMLQKRAITIKDRFEGYKKTGDLNLAKIDLVRTLNFVLERAQRGFFDKAPNIINNFGFIENTPVEFDVGGFYRDSNKTIHHFYVFEMEKLRRRVIKWLDENYSELTSFANEKIDQIILKQEYLSEELSEEDTTI